MTEIRRVIVLTARDLEHPPIARPGEHIRIELTGYSPLDHIIDWGRVARHLADAEHIEIAAGNALLGEQIAERLRPP